MNWKSWLKGRRLIYAALGGAALVLIVLAFQKQPVQIESAIITRGRFEETITVEGQTRVREKFTVLAPVSGVLQRLRLHAGDRVARGQTVAQIQWDYPRAVTAPGAGQILRVHREDAGPIEMGQPILELGDLRRMEVVAEVLTADAARLQPGMPAHIDRWGGDTVLAARVRLIEPSAFKKISPLGVEEQRVRVLLDLLAAPEERPALGDDFTVRCSIVLRQFDQVLIAPIGALFRDESSWAVFLIERGRARKQRVELLGRSQTQAAISGVAEGAEAALYPGDAVNDGDRVRPLPR
ncbi:MAG: HlyD family efflux transporter periplasmic adaptor subunit [Leptospirales bacterium]|nr:HlyD family efflux transporter periplasmic adaptor subunit [Leptospirales bacterium]